MISAERIREKAYELWEARGRPDGTPAEDWYEAEALLQHETLSPPRGVRYGLKEYPPG